ncbi:MAG: metal-binding protein [Bacteroidetes bacterium]|nr:metal-binding protein [Bacteroidota bacterium]
MFYHSSLKAKELHRQIRLRRIQFAGYVRAKIYGKLHCQAGKRMNRQNRVFFTSVEEAKQNGYRPCGHCMKTEYQNWKNSNKRVEHLR